MITLSVAAYFIALEIEIANWSDQANPGELMLELWEKENENSFPNNPDRKMWKK